MAKVGIRLKIDVTKISKAQLFKGQKGTYLDATAFVDLDQFDQYGNSGMITQEAGQGQEKGAILGNSKVFWRDDQQAQQQQQAPQQRPMDAAMQQNVAQNNQGGFANQGQQQAPVQQGGYQQQHPKVNPQEPSIDFDDDIPF